MKDFETSIILTARTESERLPNKAWLELKGRPTIYWLIARLLRSEYPIIVAFPEGDKLVSYIMSEFPEVKIFEGDIENPLKRIVDAANKFSVNNVIRITHDDLFVDLKIMKKMVKFFLRKDMDYVYTSLVPEGVGCEIYKHNALIKASNIYSGINIEGISNYFRNDNYKWDQYRPNYEYQYQYRLTMDYQEDYELIKIMCDLMPERPCDWQALDIVYFLKKNKHLRKINAMPRVTIYIPNHNYGEYLEEAIESARGQYFEDKEIIVIDDCSTDNSIEVLKKYIYPNSDVKVMFNEKNIGLPATCNRAIKYAKGSYIVRIDADDKLLPDALNKLVGFMENNDDIGMVFPGYLEANEKLEVVEEINPPFDIDENEHHPTGALIRKRNWNDIKYDELLKGYESYKFMKEFNKRFNVGYLQECLWVKRSHEDNMSKPSKVRELIKEQIDNDKD